MPRYAGRAGFQVGRYLAAAAAHVLAAGVDLAPLRRGGGAVVPHGEHVLRQTSVEGMGVDV